MGTKELQRSFLAGAVVATLAAALVPGAASAQTEAPAAQQPSGGEQPPSGSPAPAAPPAQAAASGGTKPQADQWTYPMQGGGMYKPPAVRPNSPAQDLHVYGRT